MTEGWHYRSMNERTPSWSGVRFLREWLLLDGRAQLCRADEAAQALVEARRRSGLTQQALAERSGIRQSVISRLERGNGNPSVRTLQRLAEGMGMRLELAFVPEEE